MNSMIVLILGINFDWKLWAEEERLFKILKWRKSDSFDNTIIDMMISMKFIYKRERMYMIESQGFLL